MIEYLNPPMLVFTSYGLGVILGEMIKRLGYFEFFENRNLLTDKQTRWLGVLVLGWLIKHTFMGWFNQKLNYTGKFDREKLRELKLEMTYAEVNHLMGFFLLQLFIFLMPFINVDWWYTLVMTLVNIVFNLYLVFLQQYNKRKIDRLLFIKKNRS